MNLTIDKVVSRIIDLTLVHGPFLESVDIQRGEKHCLLTIQVGNAGDHIVQDVLAYLKLTPWELVAKLEKYERSFGSFEEKEGSFTDSPHDLYELPFFEEVLRRHLSGKKCFSAIVLSSELIDVDKLQDYLRRDTWIGNPVVPPVLRNSVFEVRCGLNSRKVSSSQNNGLYRVFGVDGKIVGVGSGTNHSSLIASMRVNNGRSPTFSVTIDSSEIYEQLQISEDKHYGRRPKHQLSLAVSDASLDELSSALLLKKAFRAIPALKDRVQELVASEESKQQRALQERFDKIVGRKKVFLDGELIGLEPEGELEVVIISAKLERTISSVFPSFKLLTHTPRRGIDGIAHCALRVGEISRNVSVEFEYDLANFFSHEHLFAQVNLIICWQDTMDRDRITLLEKEIYGRTSESNIEGDGWIRCLRIGGFQIPILVLQQCPSLKIVN